MKRYLLSMLLICLAGISAVAQTGLAPDQNPNYAVSRDKYLKLADSLNEWHSTTIQDTYNAIDWLADRKEARLERRELRQQVRLERARWGSYNYYDGNNYYPSYRNSWGNYNDRYYYNNGYYRRNNSLNLWGLGYWWR